MTWEEYIEPVKQELDLNEEEVKIIEESLKPQFRHWEIVCAALDQSKVDEFWDKMTKVREVIIRQLKEDLR